MKDERGMFARRRDEGLKDRFFDFLVTGQVYSRNQGYIIARREKR